MRGMFAPAVRYPADPRVVFVLLLCTFSGIASLIVREGPETLEAQVPEAAVTCWSILLAVGCLATLIGVLKDDADGVFLEQIGSIVVGVTTIFYSGIAVGTAGLGSLQPIGFIFAFGLACVLRWIQLLLLVHLATKGMVQENTRRDDRAAL